MILHTPGVTLAIQRALRFILCISIYLLAACSPDTEASGKPDGEAKKKETPPALIEVGSVRAGPLHITRSYFAQVEPMQRAQLAAGASGEVREVVPRVGQQVKKGDMLVSVDRDLANAQLADLRAVRRSVEEQRAQLERDAARLENLGPEVAPQVEVERLRSQVRALDAQLASSDATIRGAQEQLRRHRVIAPFDAVVASRLVNPGDWVAPGSPVIELIDAGQVEILVNASPELLDQVKPGVKAVVRRDEHHVAATVQGVVSALADRTRTITLRLTPDEPADWLMPGQVVDAEFDFAFADPEAFIIPRDGVVDGAAGARALVVRDGKAVSINLLVVERAPEDIFARAPGMKLDDQLVIRGNERLRPGQAVKIARVRDTSGDKHGNGAEEVAP